MFGWLQRHWRWCKVCEKKAAKFRSELCETCEAELMNAVEKILNR